MFPYLSGKSIIQYLCLFIKRYSEIKDLNREDFDQRSLYDLDNIEEVINCKKRKIEEEKKVKVQKISELELKLSKFSQNDLLESSSYIPIVLPTNRIDLEIQSLNDLYISNFIDENEYLIRRKSLELQKSQVTYDNEAETMNDLVIIKETESDSYSSTENRNIRLFISSTFLDMNKEREILLKDIFPKLSKTCSERGIYLTQLIFVGV